MAFSLVLAVVRAVGDCLSQPCVIACDHSVGISHHGLADGPSKRDTKPPENLDVSINVGMVSHLATFISRYDNGAGLRIWMIDVLPSWLVQTVIQPCPMSPIAVG